MKLRYLKITLVILSLILFGFIVYLRMNRFKEHELLKKKITDQIQENDRLILEELTNFEWDKLYVFPPYSNPSKTLEAEGFKKTNHRFLVENYDEYILLVFTFQNKLETYVELPREYVRSNFSEYFVLTKDDTSFMIEEGILDFTKVY